MSLQSDLPTHSVGLEDKSLKKDKKVSGTSEKKTFLVLSAIILIPYSKPLEDLQFPFVCCLHFASIFCLDFNGASTKPKTVRASRQAKLAPCYYLISVYMMLNNVYLDMLKLVNYFPQSLINFRSSERDVSICFDSFLWATIWFPKFWLLCLVKPLSGWMIIY